MCLRSRANKWNKQMEWLVCMGKRRWGHCFDSWLIYVIILGKILLNFSSVKFKESFRELGKQGSQLISQIAICHLCKQTIRKTALVSDVPSGFHARWLVGQGITSDHQVRGMLLITPLHSHYSITISWMNEWGECRKLLWSFGSEEDNFYWWLRRNRSSM